MNMEIMEEFIMYHDLDIHPIPEKVLHQTGGNTVNQEDRKLSVR